MNGVFHRFGTRNWVFHVTIMSLVLGGLLAATVNTQSEIKRQFGLQAAGPGGRLPWLVEALKDQRAINNKLKLEVADLRAQLERYEKDLGSRSAQAEALTAEMRDLKSLLGLTPLQGPGITVILSDNKQSKLTSQQPQGDEMLFPNPNLVHDQDLLNVVNELNAAGAEAIAINGHRIVARTAIRCVGPTVMINGEPVAGPFYVRAIGNPADLENSLKMPNGVVDKLQLGGMGIRVKIERSDSIVVAAYTGPLSVKYARPQTAQRKEE